MQRNTLLFWSVIHLAIAALAWHPSVAQAQKPADLKAEVQKAIDRGVAWLTKNQDEKTGAWGNPDQPALTAMAILAFMGDLKAEQNVGPPEAVRKAYAFIRTHAKPDGGIYGNGLSVYNTALCLNSLLLDDDRRSQSLIPGAKRFLEHYQSGLELRVESGDGPGGAGALLNLSTALESLRQSEESMQQNGSEGLDFDAAMKFLERSKKPAAPGGVPLGEANDADPARGAGVSGKARGPEGRVALRGSGDMTYDGLLSLIYAPMEGGDPRLEAFLGWLQENYSIEENPGLGQQGLFYYYHSMAKVLSLRKIERLKLKDGTEVDWRLDLARKILTAQQKDGSWVNRNGRWWENDPFLVSSYALLTLQQLGPGL